jgi:hypothetical protein
MLLNFKQGLESIAWVEIYNRELLDLCFRLVEPCVCSYLYFVGSQNSLPFCYVWLLVQGRLRAEPAQPPPHFNPFISPTTSIFHRQRFKSYTEMMDIPGSRFKYSPLDRENNEIRLVRINKGSPSSDTLSCELQHFSLDDNYPHYNALSYTWGDATDTVPILLDHRRIDVTKNLFHFLQRGNQPRRVRKYPYDEGKETYFYDSGQGDEPRWYWIDALCIDQANILERNAQVPRMKEIYDCAYGIVVWLGIEADDSKLAMSVISSLSNIYFRQLRAKSIAKTPGPFEPKISVGTLFGKKEWLAVKQLFHRPWWNRAWVCQEVTTREENEQTIAWCGDDQEAWGVFGLVTTFMIAAERKGELGMYGVINMRIYTLISIKQDRAEKNYVLGGFKNERNLDLIELLSSCRRCDASDVRDKVYALLAIANDGHEIEVDYKKSVAEVYTDLATHFIVRDRNLDILGFANLESNMLLPSWVPDWTIEDCQSRFGKAGIQPNGTYRRLYHADKGLEEPPEMIGNGRVLRVRGFEFDEVIRVSCSRSRSSLAYREIVRRWHEMALSSGLIYVTGQIVTRAMQHILCADINENSIRVTQRGHRTVEKTTTTEYYGDRALLRATCNRRLILSKRKYLGLAPELTEPGDKICILGGGSVPFILRQEEGRWISVGECYIHGIMDGEAVDDFKNNGEEMRNFDLW